MSSTVRVEPRPLLEGLVILLVAAGYLLEARAIPDLFSSPGVPGPAAFPSLVGAVFAAGGAWRAFSSVRRSPAAPRPAAAAPPRPGGWLARHGRFCALWAVLLGYLALMPRVGFPAATVPALLALFLLLGERRWPVAVGLSVAATGALYALFGLALGVRLPLT
jgi:hypothetical protein